MYKLGEEEVKDMMELSPKELNNKIVSGIEKRKEMKKFFTLENLEKILEEEGKRVKNYINTKVTKEDKKIIFKGDHRQLLIFQLIRNKIVFKFSDYENLKPIGSHRLDCGPYMLSWDSRTNVTSVVLKEGE